MIIDNTDIDNCAKVWLGPVPLMYVNIREYI